MRDKSFRNFLDSKVVSLLLFAGCVYFGFFNLAQAPLQFWDEATNLGVILETSGFGDSELIAAAGQSTEHTKPSPKAGRSRQNVDADNLQSRAEVADVNSDTAGDESVAAPQDEWDLVYRGEYFWEKPPLYYWLGIGALKLGLGAENLLIFMRVVSAISGQLIISLSWIYVYRRLRSGFAGPNCLVLLYLSSGVFWLNNPSGKFATHHFRSADSDSLQILLIVIGILAADYLVHRLKQWLTTGRDISRWSRLALALLVGIASGLAVMLKGAWGVLPLMYLAVMLTLNYKLFRLLLPRIVLYLSLSLVATLLIILPWHIYMWQKFGPEFWNIYFIYHQLSRASSSLEGHREGFLFYILQLFDPRVSSVLLAVVMVVWLHKFKERLLVFGVVVLSILSLLGTKLLWYTFYALPFLTLGAAFGYDQLRDKNKTANRKIKIAWIKYLLGLIIFAQIIFNFINISFRLEVYDDNYAQGNEQLIYTTGELDRIIYYKSLLQYPAEN